MTQFGNNSGFIVIAANQSEIARKKHLLDVHLKEINPYNTYESSYTIFFAEQTHVPSPIYKIRNSAFIHCLTDLFV